MLTLVDRHNHHLFQPMLYQVATASLSPADIAIDPLAVPPPRRGNWLITREDGAGMSATDPP